MKMTITSLALICFSFVAVACHPTHPHGCPPGQAKKGNCISSHPAAYHCPPGHAKRGRC